MSNHTGKIKLITRNGNIYNLYIILKNHIELCIPTTLEALGVSSAGEIGEDIELTESGVEVSRRVPEVVGVVERVRGRKWIV